MTETFAIVPADLKWPLVVSVSVLALLLALAVLMGVTVHGSQKAKVEIGSDGLRLTGGLYGRFIPRAALVTERVRVVDFVKEPELAPALRTNGVALPGYRAGWFKLADGSKALLQITDETRVVFVPTTLGYGLLLSPTEPHAFAEALRRAAR